ncbi:N-acetylglucosamine-6-phosphate deacetylase [Sphingosinicella terrae]|uniref:N-acetylglucosamine-6-phosphate deacetylase n=1 Tax=Sphingosinicella terrae TaxID=2172047 RepID=UPI000E0CD1D7|nr:N-acetylglucosamine-6-phosphate deacetylase [Sphingosinicella terrae]
MATAFLNARVLTDGGFAEGLAVLVEGDRIVALVGEREIPSGAGRVDLAGEILAPGFVDVQVNGGGGVLFNDAPTVETIAAIGRAHRAFGTTGFLPTLISDDLSVVREGIAAVDTAIAAGVPGVLGIHIEGPYLNSSRKGIHDSSKIRELDEQGLKALTGLRHGRTLVTLAPERTTVAMIRRLADAGTIVSAGHSNGRYEEIRAALDSGLAGFTHLFNAMSPLRNREPGAVGAALEDRASWCGLIVDGRHVHPAAMRLALRCKGAERIMLVTDAMPSVGLEEKDFMLQGRQIRVEDGVCVTEDGTLAGSDLDMAMAVRNAIAMLDVDAPTALAMASLHPAEFLRLDRIYGRIAPGLRASLVALDGELHVTRTWIDGVECDAG